MRSRRFRPILSLKKWVLCRRGRASAEIEGDQRSLERNNKERQGVKTPPDIPSDRVKEFAFPYRHPEGASRVKAKNTKSYQMLI